MQKKIEIKLSQKLCLWNHNGGKSTFSKLFLNNKFDKTLQSTHILNIQKIRKRKYPQSNFFFFFFFYDFGGQDYPWGIYKALWQITLKSLIFWKQDSNNNNLGDDTTGLVHTKTLIIEYWIKQVTTFWETKTNHGLFKLS